MYGAARASTRSPANITRSSGSQATTSPEVWPRPRKRSSTTRPPRSTVISSVKVTVGQVSPGIVSMWRNRRGKRGATFLDQRPGAGVGDHPVGLEGGGAEGTHRVVVGQQQVADRLVGHGAQLVEPL